MISDFLFIEIVWLAFFHKPQIFFILISQNFLVVFVTEHTSDKNLGYSNVE